MFILGEEQNDFIPGLTGRDVEFLLNPGLEFQKLLFLLGLRSTQLATNEDEWLRHRGRIQTDESD
jgi:hypothetical protein